MNILRTAALVAVFIKCVTARADMMSQFRAAVDVGDIDKAIKMRWLIWGPDERLNYVVDTKNQEFIFKFAREARNSKQTLCSLHFIAKIHQE